MGKKEPSKGREWEKGRRDILNQTFLELHKALPSYSDGASVSKKTILTQALAYIQELEQVKKSCRCCSQIPGRECEENSQPLTALSKWILDIVNKIQQLASLLKASGIIPPDHLLSFNSPPFLSGSLGVDIVSEIEKIGSSDTVKVTQPCRIPHEKKIKVDSKSRHYQGASVTSKSTSVQESSSPKKCISEQETKCSALNKVNSPVVVQHSASTPLLPSQIVFASNAPNSSMATSLPLLVSVTGVKTVNPLILVQSNVVASSPSLGYTHQRLTPNCSQARPIQPGPPSKASKKLKKIPIPSLRQKSILPLNFIPKSLAKISTNKGGSSNSISFCDLNTKRNKKKSKSKSVLKVVSKKKSKITPKPENFRKSSDNTSSKCLEVQDSLNQESSCVDVQGVAEVSDSTMSVMHDSYKVREVDKENVALNVGSAKVDCDSSKSSNFTPFSTSTCNIVQDKIDFVASEDFEKNDPLHEKCSSKDAIQHSVLGTEVDLQDVDTSHNVVEEKSNAPSLKRSTKSDVPLGTSKRSKCNISTETQDSVKSSLNLPTSSALHPFEEVSSNSSTKTSKSNYTISALCAQQQQLLQQSAASPLQSGMPLESISSKCPDTLETRQLIQDSRSNVSNLAEPIESRNPNQQCLNVEKAKDLGLASGQSLTSDQYIEWPEKSKGKGERLYSNFSLFSNFTVHNNKNSFIPISDIDNYKAMPDTFDSSENSFGLPLNTSDISGDIFASLQVPPGGQHPESISPTAAFLLAFPLVSSSKATELLTEDAVCENADSQSGMKTILQIGNLDGDTPVTKCVSVFSTSTDANSIVYSAPNEFPHDSLTEVLRKSKGIDSASVDNFSVKEHSVEPSKVQVSPLKQTFGARGPEISSRKEGEQLSCGESSKQPCQPRNSSGVVNSAFGTIEVESSLAESSRLQEKIMNKASSLVGAPNNGTLQKTTLKPSSNSNPSQGTSFLTCQKHNWSEHSSSQTFGDFSVLSNTRTDCAINFPVPSTISSLSSSTSETGETVVSGSLYRAQPSCNSILSWSTLPGVENTLSSRSTKLAPFRDTFPSTKVSDKADQSHSTSVVLCPNVPNSETSYNQQLNAPGFLISDKVSSSIPHFDQDPNSGMKMPPSSNSFAHGLELKLATSTPGFGMNPKHNASINFTAHEKVVDPKKTYQSNAVGKQANTVCSMTEMTKVSQGSATSVLCSHQSMEVRNEAHVSSGIVYSTASEAKQKSRGMPCNQESEMGSKACINALNHVQSSKHPCIVPHFSQTTPVQDLKSASSISVYDNNSGTTLKEPVSHNSVMNIYGNGSEPKQNDSVNNNFSNIVEATVEHKKDGPLINQNISLPVPKPITSVVNYNSSGHRFSDNSLDILHGQQQTYKVISHDSHGKQQGNGPQHQVQQRQPQQQLQNCVRSSKESTTNMMHRPPVNWMTAPDIRSHQHHNGPSFGNASNMSATQGILYLPDSENGGSSSVFDSAGNFHCIDITHSGQSLYKSNELHLFGNDAIETVHENSSWSPNKSGSSSMLGNMLIPSTLPTLVGDLALGDNGISRPFFPAFGNSTEPVPFPKKSKRVTHAAKRVEKVEDIHASLGQECPGTFLSVSQLVDSGNVTKSRNVSSAKESVNCTSHFLEQNNPLCHVTKQIPKSVSSNYSTEALLSSSSLQQSNQSSVKKRRSSGTPHYHNNYVSTGTHFHTSNNNALQSQVPQAQFIPEIGTSRANDYQGTFIHSDSVPPFMMSASSRSQRNQPYNVTSIAERSNVEDQPNSDRNIHLSTDIETNAGSAGRQRPVTSGSSTMAPSSSNIMDFGYINMQPAMLSDDLGYSNHHPPPFLPHHTYPSQDTLYSTPRLSMHTHHSSQNNNVQSPSATTLTNFHLSTIFPEINEKVIC